ncbi:hypothetical protein EDC02_7119 [Micromonospora sp. Llam0]|uniref:DUF7019 family protein n=1 Tax=Micromonospora sp. Llam0 TaxID=2485143 RepID=UPI000F490663|nr:SAVMC3_10250 family protein [Micromonospora sp. Llam0]ROO52209.1 hypothetical protein EDC02_7119 [Micromonospora sp. Llam0]
MFRYYVYISDSKIDMLLSQIDRGFMTKRTSEIGVNLKVLTAKRTAEPAEIDRIARLERVVGYLQDYGDLGSVDEPGQFFGGLLPMQWGPFPGSEPSSLVFFGGQTDHAVVGLGGSDRHVLGALPASDGPAMPSSLMPTILDHLSTSSDVEDELVVEAAGDIHDVLDRSDRAALVTVHQAVRRLRGVAQNVEFVAKRLLHGPSPFPHSDPRADMSVLLGSPIYVALAD